LAKNSSLKIQIALVVFVRMLGRFPIEMLGDGHDLTVGCRNACVQFGNIQPKLDNAFGNGSQVLP
jgi:hypothetical protein